MNVNVGLDLVGFGDYNFLRGYFVGGYLQEIKCDIDN